MDRYREPVNQIHVSTKESTVDKFLNTKQRIVKDKQLIEKTCARYLGSLDPWLPVTPPKNGICGMCYYIEENKKLGHCANAKVIDFYHSVSFTVLESLTVWKLKLVKSKIDIFLL